MQRRCAHRATFLAAGVYNVAWGTLSSLHPQWFFRAAGMPPLNHAEIFACLGMVLGLYGLLYLEVARVPERGWLPAAVGFVGKLLGPIGAVVLIAKGTWPARFFWHCVANDLIGWIPFALYLRDAWPEFRAGIARPAASGEGRDER